MNERDDLVYFCICADPENCTQPIPGRLCRKQVGTSTRPEPATPRETDDIDTWRLVRAGEVAPLRGEHGSWVETDHPAVIACMGSEPACAENGCQARKLREYVQHLSDCELAGTEPTWVVSVLDDYPQAGRPGVCTCGLADLLRTGPETP